MTDCLDLEATNLKYATLSDSQHSHKKIENLQIPLQKLFYVQSIKDIKEGYCMVTPHFTQQLVTQQYESKSQNINVTSYSAVKQYFHHTILL